MIKLDNFMINPTITVDDEIELLEKYILNSTYKKTIQNNTTTTYMSEGSVYPFTNDILKSSINIDLTDKKSLVVTSSGDHALHAILKGSTDITCFDINRFCKYYAALKVAAIKRYSYEEFHEVFIKFIKSSRRKNYDIFSVNKVILDSALYLTDDELKFWNFYLYLLSNKNVFDNFMYSPLFYNDYSDSVCTYSDKDSYNELKNKLFGINITYIDSDIGNLHKNVNQKYDYIHVSNILDYLKSNTILLKNIKMLYKLLEKDGIVDACVSGSLDKFYDNVESKIGKYFIIDDFECEDPDAVRLIKKEK